MDTSTLTCAAEITAVAATPNTISNARDTVLISHSFYDKGFIVTRSRPGDRPTFFVCRCRRLLPSQNAQSVYNAARWGPLAAELSRTAAVSHSNQKKANEAKY